MVIEITKEEIEQELLRIINRDSKVVDLVRIDCYTIEDEQALRVLVQKKNKWITIHSLTVAKGDAWKRFLLWTMADGFNLLNECIIKSI